MDILAPTSIKNLRQIKKFLTEKSLGLSEMYQATYSRIKSSDATTGDLARRVILWICYAQRPLHEVELQHAIATELEDEDFDPDGITPGDLLRSSCMGLVTYDDEGMYSLFHLTAYEFFRSNPDMTSDASHLLISRTCLAYLSFSSTGRQGPCEDLATLEARKLEFRLLDYAAKHGADHIRQVEAALLEDVISFLHEDTLRQAFMQAFYHRHRDDEDLRRITFEALPSGSSPLQVACGRGLVSTAEKLLQDGADPESHDAQGWTPLIAATSYGHLRVVQLLLSRAETTNGSVTNFSDFAYNKNAWYQNRSSVGLNRPDNNGWTPLFWAIIKNQYKAAEQLLIAGSYIGVQDEAEWTPIDWAAFRADRAFVDLILRFTPSGQLKGPRRERPMIYRPQKFSPLFLAAAGGDHQSIEAMLKFGIESPTTTTTTKESMGMLFDFLAKVDPRSKDYREGHGSTSLPSLITTNDFSTKLLESAILLDQRTIVKMLVELGASLGPVKTEVKKRSPLHIASCCGHYQICEYLLLKGASPSLLDADGLTAMDLAIMIGHPKCVRLFLGLSTPSSSLLERGTSLTTFVFGLGYGGFGKIRSRTTHDEEICCDPRLPESALPMLETRTPGSHGTLFDTQPASTSQGTFEFGDMADVVKALFRPGCDLEAKNECWKPVDEYWESNVVWTDEKNTALHHACFIASPGLISFLLTKGAQVNPQNDAGETPLHEACSRYGTSGETIRRLVLHGANINALDKNGHSPLINACKHTSIEVIQCLVANGAVVKTYGDNDYHPLHAACQRDTKPSTALMETIEIIDYLISLSNSDILSFECQDPSCGSWAVTALHIAIRAKNWEVVEHLQTLGATITNPSFLSFDLWECARDPRGRNFRRLLDLGASASGMHSSYPFIYHTFIAHYLGRYLWAHKTADHGFEEDLEALLLAGADINARSRFDSAPLLKDVTVLRMALCTGLDDSFIQILLRHGAVEDEEVEIQSTEGGLTEDETTEDESIEVEVAC
jgi:ankyrin repeat protein